MVNRRFLVSKNRREVLGIEPVIISDGKHRIILRYFGTHGPELVPTPKSIVLTPEMVGPLRLILTEIEKEHCR